MQNRIPTPLMVMFVVTACPSTVAETVATPAKGPAVKTAAAIPDVVGRKGGAIDPCGVVANPTGIPFGTKPEPDVSTPSEFMVSFAVIADVWPGLREDGTAVMLRTSQGLKSTLPVTGLHPALPGPALQPHQLFSATTSPDPALVTPFPTMLLKLMITVGVGFATATPTVLAAIKLLIIVAFPAASIPVPNRLMVLPTEVPPIVAIEPARMLTPVPTPDPVKWLLVRNAMPFY